MMKKFLSLCAFAVIFVSANAQTQKNWYFIGGDLSKMALNFQTGNTSFEFGITPKIAWFVKDNLAVGGQVNFDILAAKGLTNVSYGLGPIVRYYFQNNALAAINKTRWFLDANAGIEGANNKVSGVTVSKSNGLGLGFGPGLAYFVNQNIALEGLVKYNFIKGFGNSSNQNSLNFGLGFQVYLPQSKLRAMRQDINRPLPAPSN